MTIYAYTCLLIRTAYPEESVLWKPECSGIGLSIEAEAKTEFRMTLNFRTTEGTDSVMYEANRIVAQIEEKHNVVTHF